ncbi:energy-coupling factor transporter transmembrane protein EcfT, partial [Streptomyces cavourensis]|nr:energy-coupling factor transporter transmembrane protein EcfT [Streptomyces cavourensis]
AMSRSATSGACWWTGRSTSADPEALHPGVVPLTAPELPLWPAAAVLVGLVPALVAPVPPSARGLDAHDRSGKEQA